MGDGVEVVEGDGGLVVFGNNWGQSTLFAYF
jgi:hypothetical protein